MRTIPLALLAAVAAVLPGSNLPGEDPAAGGIRTPPATTEAIIPIRTIDVQPSPPPAAKPDFHIESTQAMRMDVVRAPEMPGLPPVEGTITVKVHTVTDPGLPDPPPPLPPLPLDDPQVTQRLAEMTARYKETRIVFISATVYDHSRTLLRCHPNGNTGQETTAWSNLDFNHFCGIGGFEATGAGGPVRRYSLLMGIGNQDTARLGRSLAAKGIEYNGPAIPALPNNGPAFVILTANPDPGGVTLVEDLHALYRGEGARMAAAYAARGKAREDRKAFLLANPPEPKDVTIHFWKREKPAAPYDKEGGRP